MPSIALRAVFQVIVVNKLSYAASAWYASAADRGRLEAFLRRPVSFGYRDASAPSLAHICAQADDKLRAFFKAKVQLHIMASAGARAFLGV